MFDELKKYKNNNHFFFSINEDLSKVCNAPNNIYGIYIIYALTKGRVKLIYIESSGVLKKDGNIQLQNKGLYESIVNGEQNDQSHKKSWPIEMQKGDIEALDIYWYETFNNELQDIPNYIKAILLQRYYELNGELPDWNEEY